MINLWVAFILAAEVNRHHPEGIRKGRTRVTQREKNYNILLLHHKPSVREGLKVFLPKGAGVFEASRLAEALHLARTNFFHLVVAEAAQGDFSSLAGIIPPEAGLFLISTRPEELNRALRTWPENRLAEAELWPVASENQELFRRRLRRALEGWPPDSAVVDPVRSLPSAAWESMAAEIKALKGFFRQKVLEELERRLSWEIRCLLAEQEKQKIQIILRKIYAADDVNSLLDCVHDIKDIVKAQSLTFYILDESETLGKFLKPLVFADAFLAHPDFVRYNVPLAADDFAAHVARKGEPLNISQPQTDGRFAPRYREQLPWSLKSLLVVPVMHDREVIGVIETYNKKGRNGTTAAFSAEDLRLLRNICEHISMAMTKLNLIQYDALTGLLRPEPFFEKILQKIHNQSKRRIDIGHCAMVMGDVDWFKNYNDLHGHEAGNRLLRELAGVLKASIREEDFLCRYGGEEFLFFLTGVKNLEEACVFTDRIRRMVEEHYFPYQEDQPRKNLTMSFGVTLLPQENISANLSKEDLKKLVAEADSALAEAKGKRVSPAEAAGKDEIPPKNRVCAFPLKREVGNEWKVFAAADRQQREEKRRHARYFISTPLLILEDDGIKVTKTINLSLSGAKVCLSSDLPAGRPLRLTILLEDRACQLHGNVVYQEKAADTPPLFHAGIEFFFPSPAMQKILEDYLLAVTAKSSAIN